MYELQNINKEIVSKYEIAIKKVELHHNVYNITKLALIDTFKSLVPELDDKINEVFVILFLEPILRLQNTKKIIRNFSDTELIEAKKIYFDTYKATIDALEEKCDDVSKNNLELIDYIYELLEYDKVFIQNNISTLYSTVHLTVYYREYLKSLEQLELLQKSKPPEKNIDIATNTNKSYKDKIKFLEDILSSQLINPNINNRDLLEIQKKFLQLFENESRMMARSIHALSNIQKGTDDFYVNAIGDLEAFIDSDMEITKEDLYMSWYAHIFQIYDHPKINLTKKLKLARLSSYVVFPELKNNTEFEVSEYTAKKPIRERAFFKGLRLLEFTDNRLKITKSDEEIKFTESYFEIYTFFLDKYLDDSTTTTS